MRTIIITFLTFNFSILGLYAQCDYEYQDKDMITNQPTFKTKKFVIADGVKKKKTYSTREIEARFEKSGENGFLVLEFKMNTYDKMIMFNSFRDSLSLKFSNGDIVQLGLTGMPTLRRNVLVQCDLKYIINEKAKSLLKQSNSVAGLRIKCSSFDIDIEEFVIDLASKYRECWIE